MVRMAEMMIKRFDPNANPYNLEYQRQFFEKWNSSYNNNNNGN